jgi:hypothetical protein
LKKFKFSSTAEINRQVREARLDAAREGRALVRPPTQDRLSGARRAYFGWGYRPPSLGPTGHGPARAMFRLARALDTLFRRVALPSRGHRRRPCGAPSMDEEPLGTWFHPASRTVRDDARFRMTSRDCKAMSSTQWFGRRSLPAQELAMDDGSRSIIGQGTVRA